MIRTLAGTCRSRLVEGYTTGHVGFLNNLAEALDDLAQSALRREYSLGVRPTNLRKCLVKWLWSEKPTTVAICAEVMRSSCNNRLAHSTRCRVRYWCGAKPIDR